MWEDVKWPPAALRGAAPDSPRRTWWASLLRLATECLRGTSQPFRYPTAAQRLGAWDLKVWEGMRYRIFQRNPHSLSGLGVLWYFIRHLWVWHMFAGMHATDCKRVIETISISLFTVGQKLGEIIRLYSNFWPFLYGFGWLSMRSRLHPFSLPIGWVVSFCISIFGPFLYPLNSPVNLRLVSPFPPPGPREVFRLIRACAKSAAYGSARCTMGRCSDKWWNPVRWE